MNEHERNQYMDRWLNEIVGPMKGQIANFSLPALNQLVSVIQQAAVFDWQGTLRRATHGSGGNTIVSLSSLAAIDNMGADLAAGVCPIPLYELTVDDLELFQSGADNEAIIAKLKRLGIHQYFFPHPTKWCWGL